MTQVPAAVIVNHGRSWREQQVTHVLCPNAVHTCVRCPCEGGPDMVHAPAPCERRVALLAQHQSAQVPGIAAGIHPSCRRCKPPPFSAAAAHPKAAQLQVRPCLRDGCAVAGPDGVQFRDPCLGVNNI
jgi:hypothetical protein